jgi:hypothetical protein
MGGDTPRRIQRQRAKGWRMPPNTVYVGRPTKWGNPFTLEAVVNWHLGAYYGDRLAIWREEAACLYRLWATHAEPPEYWRCPGSAYHMEPCALDFSALRGKNLACWCRLGEPCHADVLLELANAPLVCEARDA